MTYLVVDFFTLLLWVEWTIADDTVLYLVVFLLYDIVAGYTFAELFLSPKATTTPPPGIEYYAVLFKAEMFELVFKKLACVDFRKLVGVLIFVGVLFRDTPPAPNVYIALLILGVLL